MDGWGNGEYEYKAVLGRGQVIVADVERATEKRHCVQKGGYEKRRKVSRS